MPTRKPSVKSSVNTAPTVGPKRTNMPPAITAKTICSDTPMPDTVSGLTYCWYRPNSAPPSAVSAAEIIVMVSLVRVTLTPTLAEACSSLPMASIA